MALLSKRSDSDIREDVIDALNADVRVDESGISVDVVGGTVYLTGVVPTLIQKRVAGQIAGRIKGVIAVQNDLQTSPLFRRSDIDIESDVKAALKRDAWVDEKRITVRVDEGIVYLAGTAQDAIIRSAAEEDARSIRGVVDVVNDIALVPAPARLDAEIADDVRATIERNLRVRPKQIHVEVIEGVVYLKGAVDRVEQRWIAEDLARWIPGVADVINELKVSAP